MQTKHINIESVYNVWNSGYFHNILQLMWCLQYTTEPRTSKTICNKTSCCSLAPFLLFTRRVSNVYRFAMGNACSNFLIYATHWYGFAEVQFGLGKMAWKTHNTHKYTSNQWISMENVSRHFCFANENMKAARELLCALCQTGNSSKRKHHIFSYSSLSVVSQR